MAPKTIARQLGELLQEQQEPFILDVYLSERGCVRNNFTSGSGVKFSCFQGNSSKFGSPDQGKKGIPHLPKVLKHLLCNKKLFTIKGSRTNNSDDEDGKPVSTIVTGMDRNIQEMAEPDGFSSASCTTVYNSCSDSDIDEPSMFAHNSKSNSKLSNESENKVAADTKFQWSCMEDSSQYSPQSVLEKICTSTGSQLVNSCKTSSQGMATEDSMLTASLWRLLVETTPEDISSYTTEHLAQGLQQHDWYNNSSSKRVLQQTKQLLFDCVRELVDKHDTDKQERGLKEIGKFICEKIIGWGKRCGNESNIKPLLETDVMESTPAWNDHESQKKEIGIVIGNAIAEELTNQVVLDIMINHVL